MGKKYFNFSVALPLIAGLTPRHYDIKIIDESVDAIPKDILPDIVGLTAFTFTKERSYEIAKYYRDKGIPVIMGGAHVSFSKDEALNHVDSVIIGEAELVWQRCLEDFEKGNLQSVYQADRFCEFKKSPLPRWDLVPTKELSIVGVQATRGCPFACEFCIVGKMLGKKQRRRDIADLIAEIKRIPLKRIFFVDDNLTWDKVYLKALLVELKKLRINWACNASIEIGNEPLLLMEMADAGCISIFVGFESLNAASLKETHKEQNVIVDYDKIINNIHKAGISIIASFVVGFDHDELNIIEKIYHFTLKHHLLFANIYFLLPVPGSNLAEKIVNEKRVWDLEADFLNANFPSFHYKNFSGLAIYDSFYENLKKMFSFEVMSEKVLSLLESGNLIKSNTKGVTAFDKLKSSLLLLKRYHFSGDPLKKAYFKRVFNLGKKKLASWDHIAYLSLAMLSFGDYLSSYHQVYQEARKVIKKMDETASGIINS